MSVVSENMTRASALLIARANVASDGKDWLVYEVENALEITRHVRLRNDAPFLSDDDELEVIELCACGRCRPGALRCQAANVAASDYKSEPSVERNEPRHVDKLTPPFDAGKLEDLLRHEQIAQAATQGAWHRGTWAPVYEDEKQRNTIDTKLSLDFDRQAAHDTNGADFNIVGDKPTNPRDWYRQAHIIGGCGCCGSPFGRPQDAEHVAHSSPENVLRLIARAKMLARFVELCDRWLVTLMTVHDMYRLVLTSKVDEGTQLGDRSRSYRSPDLERLINHAWSNAPSGDV